jgi:hypothetical protein
MERRIRHLGIFVAPADEPTVAVAVSVPNRVPSSTGAGISGPPTGAILRAALGY